MATPYIMIYGSRLGSSIYFGFRLGFCSRFSIGLSVDGRAGSEHMVWMYERKPWRKRYYEYMDFDYHIIFLEPIN